MWLTDLGKHLRSKYLALIFIYFETKALKDDGNNDEILDFSVEIKFKIFIISYQEPMLYKNFSLKKYKLVLNSLMVCYFTLSYTNVSKFR